jgi:hypothetical protein
MLKKYILAMSMSLITALAADCATVYGDTKGLDYCLSLVTSKQDVNMLAVNKSVFEVQRDPHIVKLSNNMYCYREDISVKACVLISKDDALKAIREYRD